MPVVWGGGSTVDLGDGLCSGVGEFDYNAYFQFEGYAVYYYFNIDGDYGEGWQDDNGYNGENVDGITTLTRLGARDADLSSNSIVDLNGINPVSPFFQILKWLKPLRIQIESYYLGIFTEIIH